MATIISPLMPVIRPIIPHLRPLKKRFIAGETFTAALEAGIRLNDLGFSVIFSYAGEHQSDRFFIEKTAGIYRILIRHTKVLGLNADVSIKPSQLGAEHKRTIWKGIWPDEYPEIAHILKSGGADKVRVWFDAEYLEMRRDVFRLAIEGLSWADEVGMALQAYGAGGYDSVRFFQEAIAYHVRRLPAGKTFLLRICKGAYRDPLALASAKEIS